MSEGVGKVTAARAQPLGARRALAVAAGVAAISVASQISVPLAFTPVPWTLQPLAVLLVGGLLGPRLGPVSVATYLVVGALGLPVFTPGGAVGLLRFAGPTGGYLLAYPVAAMAVGALAGPAPRVGRAAIAAAVGLAVVHLGGLAQLALLTGDWGVATRLGSLPFLVGDGVKIAIAALLVGRFAGPLRARL
jgi:biotin transport system substrate-specific component